MKFNEKDLYNAEIYKIKIFFQKKKLIKILIKYYNYIDIFNKFKIDKLFSYRFYNYKLKFINKINKMNILKNRIYLILNYKLK